MDGINHKCEKYEKERDGLLYLKVYGLHSSSTKRREILEFYLCVCVGVYVLE